MKNLTKYKYVLRPLIPVAVVWVIAFFGSKFVEGWNWTLSDFLIMGGLIFVTGLLVELANMKIKNKNQRIAVIAVIVVVLLLTWVHLAVGIVDTWPFAGS